MSPPRLAAPGSPPPEAGQVHSLLARPEHDRTLGPYRLLRQLGRGGFAPVWLAEEAHDGKRLRDVAIKLFFLPETIASASPEAMVWREGVLEEARALCRVEHPNVVRFYALQRDDPGGVIGLVMEHVAGESLDVRLEKEGRLGEATVIEIGIGVAWALAAVHDAGLVHRDVKPGNVIQGSSGYKLIDFGIVVDAPRPEPRKSAHHNASALIGTRGYMAPECVVLGAPSTPSSDLFGLGATLFKLARGFLPPAGSPVTERPASARAPNELADLTALLLEPDPDRRPRHDDWVARELERLRAQPSLRPVSSRGFQAPRFEEIPAERPIPRAPSEDVPTRTDGYRDDLSAPPELCQHPPLIGRDDVLAALARAAREASAGGVRVVLLSGPLGMGRTRLLEAAVERSAPEIHRVLRARCSPERPSPLRPLLRALEALSHTGARALDLVRDALERALQPGALAGPDEASQALEAIEDALVWASNEAPILLAVDDIQWGDTRTLSLLRLLIERTDAGSTGKLLVVATARNEPNPSPALRALLRQVRSRIHAGVRHIALEPLTAEQAAGVARAVSPIAPEVERAVVRGSGHVPFFVVHALLGWRETGAILWREGAWRPASEQALGEDVPGVADLLEARVGSCLDPDSAPGHAALRVLAAVALVGEGLDTETLLGVVRAEMGADGRSSTEAALRALEALVEAGILTLTGERQEVGFAQEMVRQAVRNLLRRRPWFCRLHRALLDTIAESPCAAADAAFLATGYEKLGAREPARLWLERAMDAAIAAGLFEEAAALGDRLIALTPDLERRAGVELTIVRALVRGRRFEPAKQRLARVVIPSGMTGGAADLRARICRLEAARGLCEVGVVDAVLVSDADALGDPTLRCEARMALAGVSPEEIGLPIAGEAVALAPQCGIALEFAARVLRAELSYASNRRDLAQVEADLTRALAIATAMSSTWQQLHIEGDLAVIEAELGRVGAAIDRLRRLSERAESLGMRAELRLVLQNLGAFLLREGRAAEAAETAKRTADLATEAGDPALRATSLSLRAEALRRAGDLEAALDCVNEASLLQQGRRDPSSPLTLLRRAEILDALERVEEALDDARRAHGLAEQLEDRDLALGAVLWENLRLARRGEIGREPLEQALAAAEAAGVTLRALTRSLMAQAREWLSGVTVVDPRMTGEPTKTD